MLMWLGPHRTLNLHLLPRDAGATALRAFVFRCLKFSCAWTKDVVRPSLTCSIPITRHLFRIPIGLSGSLSNLADFAVKLLPGATHALFRLRGRLCIFDRSRQLCVPLAAGSAVGAGETICDFAFEALDDGGVLVVLCVHRGAGLECVVVSPYHFDVHKSADAFGSERTARFASSRSFVAHA